MFSRRIKMPTVLQDSPQESGAACLAAVLGGFGRHVSLGEAASVCASTSGVSGPEDLVRAARPYGLEASLHECAASDLAGLGTPLIAHCGQGRFLVLEGKAGWTGRNWRVMDPAAGARTLGLQELARRFAGQALVLSPGPEFQAGGRSPSLTRNLLFRFPGMAAALALALLAGLLLVIPGVAQPGFTRIFIDHILNPERRDWLRPLLLAMIASLAVIWSLGAMQRQTILRQILKSSISGSARFVTRALRLPFAFFTRFHSGETALRSQYFETVSRIIAEDLTATAVSLISIGLYALVMFQFDPTLTMVAVLLGLLNIVVMKLGMRKGQDLFARTVAENGRVQAAGLNGLQTIESLKASGWEREYFAYWAGIKARSKNSAQQIPVLLTDLSMAAVLGIGALRVMRGEMSMGMLAAFQVLLLAFLVPVQKFMNSGANLLTLGGYIRRINDVMAYPLDPLFTDQDQTSMPGIGRPTGQKPHPVATLFSRRGEKIFVPPAPAHDLEGDVSTQGVAQGLTGGSFSPQNKERLILPGVGVRLGGGFELREVTFGYAPGRPLIHDFSLRVAPGSRVALVGASGSGKSTIIRLIAQLYRPWSGEILFDGVARAGIPRLVFTNSVAFVDQEIFLFEGSVRDNLTMWNPAIAEHDVIRAARDARIHAEISSRAGAYHSRVLWGGANFSGGQRQRLEIARALATNPSILILDEATSALDAETEERIDTALRRRGMTCLIVAHRLSTIRDADEIIVMDQGLIVERGTHENLLSPLGDGLKFRF